jgi:hypothetical protein
MQNQKSWFPEFTAPSACKAACREEQSETASERDPNEIRIQGGAIRHFSDVEKDVNKLVNKKVQCPNPALSYRVP